jgi:hypothetical protein
VNIFEPDAAQEVLAGVREFTQQAPDEALTLIAFLTVAPQPPFPPELYGKRAVLVGVNHCGTEEQAEKDLQPLRTIGSPLFQLYAPLPYSMAQSMQDVFYEAGRRAYATGGYLADLTPEIVEVLQKRAALAHGHDQIGLFQMGGAIARVPEDAMAFSGRNAAFFVGAECTWDDPMEDDGHMSWGRETIKTLQPHLAAGNYSNALTGEADESVRATYGDKKYERLVTLKNEYDPTNLFRLNTNIKPTAS